MAVRKRWSPDRRDMIWINCNPQAGREMKDIHPLLVLSPRAFTGPRKKASYILGHQPKSFDWRVRQAKPHPWKQIPEDVFTLACETLNQIITIGK